jgi:hypothetical protein
MPEDGLTCPDCGGSGKQRLAVQVPCPVITDGEHPVEHDGAECWHCADSGLVTVPGVWATQEWGPLPVVLAYSDEDGGQDRLRIHPSGKATRLSGRVWKSWDLTDVTLPPGVDPASLVGLWARGGRIEEAS